MTARVRITACAGCFEPELWREDQRWSDLSPEKPFPRFNRLGMAARGALIAAERARLAAGAAAFEPAGSAVVLATAGGVIADDTHFRRTMDRPEGPSPMIFPYTLPTAVVGELSIRFKLTGPAMTYYDRRHPAARALYEGLWLILSGDAPGALVAAVDAIDDEAAAMGGTPCVSALAAMLIPDELCADSHGLARLSLIDGDAPDGVDEIDAPEALAAWLNGPPARALLRAGAATMLLEKPPGG